MRLPVEIFLVEKTSGSCWCHHLLGPPLYVFSFCTSTPRWSGTVLPFLSSVCAAWHAGSLTVHALLLCVWFTFYSAHPFKSSWSAVMPACLRTVSQPWKENLFICFISPSQLLIYFVCPSFSLWDISYQCSCTTHGPFSLWFLSCNMSSRFICVQHLEEISLAEFFFFWFCLLGIFPSFFLFSQQDFTM